jgi:glutamine amidotransferase-like uncharacterized protein
VTNSDHMVYADNPDEFYPQFDQFLERATGALFAVMIILILMIAGCTGTEPVAAPVLPTVTAAPPTSTLALAPTSVPPMSDSGAAPLSLSKSAAPLFLTTTVGLYTDRGTADACVTAAEKMFQWMGHAVERITADTINDDDLARFGLLYFPGGSSGPYQNDISSEGREKIRQFVGAGGCFIGTCAGALFAAERIVWEGEEDLQNILALFPGTVVGPIPEIYADPEYGMCQVDLVKPHPITDGEPDSLAILYYNGPFFEPNPGAGVDIVGAYQITGQPALVAFEYGRGRVFLTGPHPEWEEDDPRDAVSYFDRFEDRESDWDLMLAATRWCLGVAE